MKLLFVQGGTRLKEDLEGNFYTDGNLNDKVWNRYKKYCDELLILLRAEEKKYTKEYAMQKFNSIKMQKVKVFKTIDLMTPKYRFIDFFSRKKVKKEIEKAVIECDKAIIRSAHNFYTLTAVKMCQRYNKPYMIEVAGYAFDGYWNHGDLFGKIVAYPYELMAKKAMLNANYCLYVTDYTLQKRYPCKGKTLGCSDVELYGSNKKDLNNRLESINSDKKMIIGTIGGVNVKLKGQKDVIKALGKLKKNGYNNFEYQLVGLGSHDYLNKFIEKYNLQDEVKFLGGMPHEKIFEWLKSIDVYIQPSHTEGLCRAIIEAMSVSCPVIVSNAGGNPELASSKYIFRKGNVKEIINILKNLNTKDLKIEAKRSYASSQKYNKEILDKIREEFYNDFINS